MSRYLIFRITYTFATAVQPGLSQAFLLSQTMSQGSKRTGLAAFEPLISDGPIILLVLIILNQVPVWLVTIL